VQVDRGRQAEHEVLEGLKERNPGLSTEHGTVFVGIAARSYCPDQLVQNPAGGAQ
jgi:hypothetical protein